MPDTNQRYIYEPFSITDKSFFSEASADELRILLALIEQRGEIKSAEQLAALAKTSKARAVSALAFWTEAGVIRLADCGGRLTDEFAVRAETGSIIEATAKETADSIRNGRLADMIAECCALMKRPALNSKEVKELVALHEQYALSEEYIVMLAAYIAEHGRLTVTNLINKAIRLYEREIDTHTALEAYIAERESDSEAEREFRKLFGIYNRAPSKTEREYFKKWSREYGYFTDIVGEAYDIAVTSVSNGHLKYADKLLTRWYETGCRTLAECKARYEADKAEKKKTHETEKRAYNKKPAERYGDFDPEEAFMKALNRSYGDSDKE